MKFKSCLTLILILSSRLLFSKVAINSTGTDPDPAAMLDVSSTSMGVLVPRLTSVQRRSIPNPPEGLLLYDTDCRSFWFVKNSIWTEITYDGSGWSLTGNTGTDTAVNFIGTTDNMPLKFKVNNQQAGWLDPTVFANTSFGYRSLVGNTTGSYNTAIGSQVLISNTEGERNTAIGYKALYSNTTGQGNTANGYAHFIATLREFQIQPAVSRRFLRPPREAGIRPMELMRFSKTQREDIIQPMDIGRFIPTQQVIPILQSETVHYI